MRFGTRVSGPLLALTFSHMSPACQDAVRAAQAVADDNNSGLVDSVALVLGVLRTSYADGCRALRDLGVRDEWFTHPDELSPLTPYPGSAHTPRVRGCSDLVRMVLERAVTIAALDGRLRVTSGDLICALADSESPVASVLFFEGVREDAVARALRSHQSENEAATAR